MGALTPSRAAPSPGPRWRLRRCGSGLRGSGGGVRLRPLESYGQVVEVMVCEYPKEFESAILSDVLQTMFGSWRVVVLIGPMRIQRQARAVDIYDNDRPVVAALETVL